jgi:hypothetical protein
MIILLAEYSITSRPLPFYRTRLTGAVVPRKPEKSLDVWDLTIERYWQSYKAVVSRLSRQAENGPGLCENACIVLKSALLRKISRRLDTQQT